MKKGANATQLTVADDHSRHQKLGRYKCFSNLDLERCDHCGAFEESMWECQCGKWVCDLDVIFGSDGNPASCKECSPK